MCGPGNGGGWDEMDSRRGRKQDQSDALEGRFPSLGQSGAFGRRIRAKTVGVRKAVAMLIAAASCTA